MIKLSCLALLVSAVACGDAEPAPTTTDAAPPLEVDAATDACICMSADNVTDPACVQQMLGLAGGACVALRCPQLDGSIWRGNVCAPPGPPP